MTNKRFLKETRSREIKSASGSTGKGRPLDAARGEIPQLGQTIREAEIIKDKWDDKLKIVKNLAKSDKYDKRTKIIYKFIDQLKNLDTSLQENDQSTIDSTYHELDQLAKESGSEGLHNLWKTYKSKICNNDLNDEQIHELFEGWKKVGNSGKTLLQEALIRAWAIHDRWLELYRSAPTNTDNECLIENYYNEGMQICRGFAINLGNIKTHSSIDTKHEISEIEIYKNLKDAINVFWKNNYQTEEFTIHDEKGQITLDENLDIHLLWKDLTSSTQDSLFSDTQMEPVLEKSTTYETRQDGDQNSLFNKILLFDGEIIKQAIKASTSERSKRKGIESLKYELENWEEIDATLKEIRIMKSGKWEGNKDDNSIINKLKSIDDNITNTGTKGDRMINLQNEIKKYIGDGFLPSINIEEDKNLDQNSLFNKILLFDGEIIKQAIKASASECSKRKGIESLKHELENWEEINATLKEIRIMKSGKWKGNKDDNSIINKLKSMNDSIINTGTKGDRMINLQNEIKKYIGDELLPSINRLYSDSKEVSTETNMQPEAMMLTGIKSNIEEDKNLDQNSLFNKILLFDGEIIKQALKVSSSECSERKGIESLKYELENWEGIDATLKEIRIMKSGKWEGNKDDNSIINKLKSMNDSIINTGTKGDRMINLQNEIKKYIDNEFLHSIGI